MTTDEVIERLAGCADQKAAAAVYQDALVSGFNGDLHDWPRINACISRRWSVSGLKRVKKIAWKPFEGNLRA